MHKAQRLIETKKSSLDLNEELDLESDDLSYLRAELKAHLEELKKAKADLKHPDIIESIKQDIFDLRSMITRKAAKKS